MVLFKLEHDWNQVARICKCVLVGAGAKNVKEELLNPYRKREEHDITVLKRLLPHVNGR